MGGTGEPGVANPIPSPGVMGGYCDPPARGVAEDKSTAPQPGRDGMDIARGGAILPTTDRFVAPWLSWCLSASSRRISSSMRLANR